VRELSLHIMDIIENGLAAGARLIDLRVIEKGKENRLQITVKGGGQAVWRRIPHPVQGGGRNGSFRLLSTGPY
jgi:hypothetical protein